MNFREIMLLAVLLAPTAALEMLWPRSESPNKARRWMVNLSLAVIWVVALGVLWPWMHPIVSAMFGPLAASPSFSTAVPVGIVLIGSALVLDFIQYWTHRALHHFQWLWYLHRVHHSDVFVDASTGVRHHPLEPLLNAPVQFVFIVLLSVPIEGAAFYSLIATVQTILAHSNIHLATSLDRIVRRVVVTPDMHRIHHSIESPEASSNFGMVFPFWDHLFGTYRDQPMSGHDGLRVGVGAQ